MKKYICTKDWDINGAVACHVGEEYEIHGDDNTRYCVVMISDEVPVAATWAEVYEHFDIDDSV